MRITNALLDQNGRQSIFVVNASDGASALIITGSSLTNANAVHVAIVDGSGNQITSFGGGTQYVNGSAQATPTGTVALGWDGANVRALSTDSTGKLQLGTITVSGTVTANAGTNLNTSALALESGGNLATLAGAVSASKMNVNVSSVTSGAAIQILDSGGTNKLAINASGQITLSNTGFNVNNTPAVTQSGNWTNRIVGNGGATLDATIGAGTAPTNMIAVGGVYNSTEIGPTTGQSAALQLDSKGRLRQVIMDAAGNTRGANVNASNQLSVSVDAIVANQSMNLAQVGGSAITLGQATMSSSIPVAIASNQGAIPVTESGTWTVQPGNTQNTTPWLSAPSVNTGAIAPSINYQATLTNTKVAVKASAGNYHGHHIYNPNNSIVYIQMFNKASASVTLGSTAPDWVLICPQGGFLDDLPSGVPMWGFGTALTLAATTTASGSTAPGSSLVATFFYI